MSCPVACPIADIPHHSLNSESGRADTLCDTAEVEMRHLPYEEWILSGRQIFLAEGVDYNQLTSDVKAKLADAAKRRGLKLATRTIFDPPGFVFQAYLPTSPRPFLGHPTQKANKKTHPYLFCLADGCDNKLRPIDGERCKYHAGSDS